MIGHYVAGSTWLHRLGATPKLVATLALVTLLGVMPRWWLLAPAAALVIGLYAAARLSPRTLWRGLRTVLVLAALLVVLQTWLHGPVRAIEVAGQLVVAVLVGNLVMMTTRVSEMVRSVSGVAIPLRRFGIERERVELMLAVTIGCIPRVAAAMTASREAASARGVKPRLAVVVPAVVVTMVRDADEIGDAMAARGL